MPTHAAVPSYRLDHLSNDDLLAGTRRMQGASNVVLAGLLAHLAEVEARGLHRLRACSSLYTYCVYELRMSEDAALRRAHAARIARTFPAVLEPVGRGEIHLTGLLMLGPHLTEQNLVEVLARAKHRTKKEIAALVRELDPLPDVPDCVEPLGPRPPARGNGSWSQFAHAIAGPVRELPPDERPADWVPASPSPAGLQPASLQPAPTPSASTPSASTPSASTPSASTPSASTPSASSRPASPPPASSQFASPQPAPNGELLAPRRYRVEFTATEEYMLLLERARDLLSHAVPKRELLEVHLRALRSLVAELEKRKYAVTDKPRPSSADAGIDAREPELRPRWRGRYVPAEVRRAVWARDEGQCTYVDERGVRCRETRQLELHHQEAHALGGQPTAENMCLRCKSHNALAAEEDFGRELIEQKKGLLTVRDSAGTRASAAWRAPVGRRSLNGDRLGLEAVDAVVRGTGPGALRAEIPEREGAAVHRALRALAPPKRRPRSRAR